MSSAPFLSYNKEHGKGMVGEDRRLHLGRGEDKGVPNLQDFAPPLEFGLSPLKDYQHSILSPPPPSPLTKF